MRPYRFIFLTVFAAALAACGSDDSSDDTSPRPDAGSGADTGDDAAQDATTQDTGAPDASGDAPADVGTDVLDAAQDVAPEAAPDAPLNLTPMGTLTVDCDVPFVLDASKVTNSTYMAGHFNDLIQEYGITGTIGGQDITAYPEKMYYGMHAPAGADPNDVLSLLQLSMESITKPSFSVRIDFQPDSDVTTGSTWPIGLEPGQAPVLLFAHPTSNSLCTYSVGMGGSLSFVDAVDVTQVEGGSFHVTGTVEMFEPEGVPDLCAVMASINAPCCS